ncbi:MAG TPA: ECF-type sigma factor [Pirellulales bacterium]|nr:ECF-type sigma factor [Pirellulales bacterium]
MIIDLRSEVTQILNAIDEGDINASAELLPLVYEQVRKLASQKIAQEKSGKRFSPWRCRFTH